MPETGSRKNKLWIAALLIFLPGILLLIGGVILRRTMPAPTQLPGNLRTLRLTEPGAEHITPGLSADGSMVAFSSNASGKFEISVRPARAGEHDRQLTHDGTDNIQPAWSPDGKSIVYRSIRNNGLFVIAAEGGEARRLTTGGSDPAWSPDGAWIAYAATEEGGAAHLWLAPAAGGEPKALTKAGVPAGAHGAPAWSPDGARVVFASDSGATTALWSIAVADGAPAQVPVTAGALAEPFFSNDNRAVFYASHPAGSVASVFLFRPPPDKLGPIEILRMPEDAPLDMNISRDGRRLAYTLDDALYLVELR